MFAMYNLALTLSAATPAPTTVPSTLGQRYLDMMQPVIDFVNTAFAPAMAFIVSAGAIYSIILGVKIAKAEEPQEITQAKAALKNGLIGFISVFVLVMILRVGPVAFARWKDAGSPEVISTMQQWVWNDPTNATPTPDPTPTPPLTEYYCLICALKSGIIDSTVDWAQAYQALTKVLSTDYLNQSEIAIADYRSNAMTNRQTITVRTDYPLNVVQVDEIRELLEPYFTFRFVGATYDIPTDDTPTQTIPPINRPEGGFDIMT